MPPEPQARRSSTGTPARPTPPRACSTTSWPPTRATSSTSETSPDGSFGSGADLGGEGDADVDAGGPEHVRVAFGIGEAGGGGQGLVAAEQRGAVQRPG